MRESVGILLVALMIGTGALAQDNQASTGGSGGAGGFKQACGSDAQSLCSSAQTPKDIRKCIRQNRQKVSNTCSSFLAERRAERLQRKESQPYQQPPPGQPAMAPNQDTPGQAAPPPG